MFYKSLFFIEELTPVIKRSIPMQDCDLGITKTEFDFNTGEFILFIKNMYIKGCYEALLYRETLNEFWQFMEESINIEGEGISLYSLHGRRETIFYCMPVPENKKRVRFMVFCATDLQIKMQDGIVMSPNFGDAIVVTDIETTKKKFLSELKSILEGELNEAETINYFEPFLLDFSVWKKHSKIIDDFLARKK